jgi:hypothetical protein
MPAGRPTDYDPEYCEQGKKLCRLGLTDKQLADVWDVSEKTLNTWKEEHPEFLQSLKKGKAISDSEVAQSLYHRARGYYHSDVHIMQFEGKPIIVDIVKHYPPDTLACIFWLKNRQREIWTDKGIDPDEKQTPDMVNVTIRRDKDA